MTITPIRQNAFRIVCMYVTQLIFPNINVSKQCEPFKYVMIKPISNKEATTLSRDI